MQISSERAFALPASCPEVWAAISDTRSYRRWWPWLRAFDAGSLEEGAVWRCTVQPPVPYTLRFTVTFLHVEPEHLIRAEVGGDITGSAELVLAPEDAGCAARLSSSLEPANPLLRIASRLVPPVVRFGHDWVLDTGARQFRDRAL